MTKSQRTTAPPSPPVLGPRALSRATLARQLLLSRSPMSATAAVEHLVGLQAQNVKPPYYALAARLDGFTPEALSRPLAVRARALVEEEPRTMKELREALLEDWPDADPQALSVAARCKLPLVQITPRGLWGRSGQVRLTTAEHWLGRPAEPAQAPDATVLRYLAAFGPASVKDMQTWAGLTRLREAFERLRPRLVTFRDENGTELFDLPDAPRPDPDTPAPPRFLPEFDNLLLSHADRTRVVPPELKGRHWKGNVAYRTLLVDGFLAGLWRLDDDALVIEPFGRLDRARRAEVTAEAERMLGVLHPGRRYDVRFGTVRE
ncbi:winged helix DNA-binding domain-containing protein [Streptomyces pseudogriseolus]|uniref:winged helix DNA-binding domain-containing protein n=1 Tax=Streptomyces pseudogriseolus TaxID=36817 RepID=UPI0036B08739